MQARKGADHPEGRAPDWAAAAVSGFAAGAILMVLDLLWTILVTGGSPWATSHKIAAIWIGPETLQRTRFSADAVTLALATHYALGIVFGVMLVVFRTAFRLGPSLRTALLTGAGISGVFYLLNFYGMVRFFPWFAEMRGLATLAAHLIFGISAALIYWKLERRAAED